jgi:hypothetical protein
MIPLHRLALAATALLAACTAAPPSDPGKAESYAVRLAVTPAEGAAEQRIVLPASALAALQSPDLADLRLFDSAGRALPLALAATRATQQQSGAEVSVFPVVGAAAPGTAGVALTIGPDRVARVTGLSGPPGEDRPVAALLDTRQVTDPAIAVTLEADLPLHQPVTIVLESSADLRLWESLGEKVLFRTDAAGTQLDAGRIALPGVALKDRYLRASWGDAKGVAVRGARVVTAKSGAPPRIAVPATAPGLEGPRELRFELAFGGPLAAVRIDPADGEGVLPVQLAARDNPEAQWTPLAAATLRKPGSPGNEIDLGGAARRQYRVTVDDRTPGFAAPPKIELLFDPVELVTQFNGKAPYTLAAGLKGAPSTLLAIDDIAPGGTAALANAAIEAGAAPTIAIGPAAADSWLTRQQTLLWLVLLAGVGVLGFAVIRLMRGRPEMPPQ